MRYLTLLITLLLSQSSFAYVPDYAKIEADLLLPKSPLYLDYIEKYKNIAIEEMARTGVPASIKLAQGILESAAGTSELSLNANNHFGMKMNCKDPGKKYYLHDDDYDSFGNLTESCFRVFSKAEDSWIGHSEFLRDPKKQYRYGWLFTDIDMTDYKAWAKGLKKSGYATNPRYPTLLIKIIEEYQLYEFDRLGPIDIAEPTAPKVKKPLPIPGVPKPPAPVNTGTVKTEIIMVNDLKAVVSSSGETIADISRRTGVSNAKLLKYNTLYSNTREPIEEGNQIFLQEKRNRYKGRAKYHYAEEGETLEEISQIYGVKVNKIKSRNDLKSDFPLRQGQKIKLRGWNIFGNNGDSFWELFKRKDDSEVDITDTDEHWMIDENDAIAVFDQSLLDDEPQYSLAAKGVGGEVFIVKPSQPEKEVEQNTGVKPNPTFYIVQPGDSLYGIAKRFEISIDDLKTLNKLNSNIIFLGQKLQVDDPSN